MTGCRPRYPGDAAITEAIIGLARGLGLRVVAEGVGTQMQLEFLSARASTRALADALDQACFLEPVDIPGERRGGDPLLGRQLAQAHPRVVADQPEERHLAAGDTELLGLAPQLARQAQQHGSQLIREGEWIGDNFINH